MEGVPARCILSPDAATEAEEATEEEDLSSYYDGYDAYWEDVSDWRYGDDHDWGYDPEDEAAAEAYWA